MRLTAQSEKEGCYFLELVVSNEDALADRRGRNGNQLENFGWSGLGDGLAVAKERGGCFGFPEHSNRTRERKMPARGCGCKKAAELRDWDLDPDHTDIWREEKPKEVRGNNRSVMPFDILGRTRATMKGKKSVLEKKKGWVGKTAWPGKNLCWKDKGNLGSPFVMGIEECKIFVNEEFLVGAAQHVASISSLAFVHTARLS